MSLEQIRMRIKELQNSKKHIDEENLSERVKEEERRRIERAIAELQEILARYE